MTVHEALNHPWLRQSGLDYRLSSSRYHPTRYAIRAKYSNWSPPIPSIGRIANYSSLATQRPRDHYIHDAHFDRTEAMPRFVVRPEGVTVREGEVASLRCSIVAASPAVVTWHFKGQALSPSIKHMPKYQGSCYELRIGRCKLEDRGNYVVKAVNSYGTKEESASLNVEAAPPPPVQRAFSVQPPTKRREEKEVAKWQEELSKPKVIFPLRDRHLQQGVSFKLIATMEANPLPKATWLKDGKEILGGGRFRLDSSGGVFTLECSGCEPQDQGRYVCTAENKLGSTSTEAHVRVNAKVNLAPLESPRQDALAGSHRFSSSRYESRPSIPSHPAHAHPGYAQRSRRAGSHVDAFSSHSTYSSHTEPYSSSHKSYSSHNSHAGGSYGSNSYSHQNGHVGGFSSGGTDVKIRVNVGGGGPSAYTSVTRRAPPSRSFQRSVSHVTQRRF